MKLTVFFFLVWTLSLQASDCSLTMTYKDGDKIPLIQPRPDNSGLYRDLFEKAAGMIGCDLKIERYPKKRLHMMLSEGKRDFYPGASFSLKRSKYLYYIENGLPTGEYGITAHDIPELKHFSDVAKHNLYWLMEPASSKNEIAKKHGITPQIIHFADLLKAQEMIALNRHIFYVADKELVDYFLQRTGFKSFKEAGIKVHRDCCGGEYTMRLGFSRFSPHFAEEPNPNFDPDQPTQPDNFPTRVKQDTVAYRLGQALKQLQESGWTRAQYRQYFSESTQ